MRRTRLLGAIVSATFLALPGAALAQSDTDVPADDNTATVVIPALPEPILADDPLTDPVDDATNPAAQDPAGLVVSDDPLTPQVETVVEDQPSDRLAPPVNDRTRWSDDRDAPRWQQDRRWRDRGIFYRWRDGWYRSERGRWWRWNSRWERCDPPPPPPRICPEPPRHDPSPTWNDGRDNQQQGPGAPVGNSPRGDNRVARAAFIRRGLLVCRDNYDRRIVRLRILRRENIITFRQYRRGVRNARVDLRSCRVRVIRAAAARF